MQTIGRPLLAAPCASLEVENLCPEQILISGSLCSPCGKQMNSTEKDKVKLQNKNCLSLILILSFIKYFVTCTVNSQISNMRGLKEKERRKEGRRKEGRKEERKKEGRKEERKKGRRKEGREGRRRGNYKTSFK
jgi:hypothetical protein